MYFSHIDGLRAIAVTLVVLFHLDISAFHGGYLGVDIFFVISGFLITAQLYNAKITHDYSIKKFYERRARRILPALYVTVLLTLIIAVFLFTPSDLSRLAEVSISSVLGGANLYFLNESGYFDISSKYKPLLHIWSLGVEIQFYLIAPFLMFFIFKIPQRWLPVVLLSLAFLSLAFIEIFKDGFTYFSFLGDLFSNGPASVFYLLPFRMFEFLAGSAAYFFHKQGYTWFKNQSAFLGGGIIAGSIYFVDNNDAFLSYLALAPCFGAFLVLYGGHGWFSEVLLGNKYITYVGKISYSTYLFHWPVIVFFNYLIEDALSTFMKLIIVSLTLFFSFLSYTFVERKFYPAKEPAGMDVKPSTQFSALKFSMIFLALTSLISVFIISGNGWTWRINHPARVTTSSEFNQLLPCPPGNDWNICEFGDGENVEIIWIGDSLMEHYLPVIPIISTGRNLAFVRGGCIFLPISTRMHAGKIDSKCITVKNKALNYLTETSGKIVVLSQFWDGYYGNTEGLIGLENGNSFEEKYESKRDLFYASLDAFLKILQQNNHKLIVLNHIIYEDYSKKLKCRNTPVNLCDSIDTNISMEILLNERFLDISMVREIMNRDILYFDPLNNFCTENESCNLMFKGKEILLRDRIHYNLLGAQIAKQGLSDIIKKARE